MAYFGGTADNDTLYGTNSRDTFDGFAGNDKIFGGGSLDFIYAGDGDDLIVGGGSRDHLYGGRGSDVFDFNAVGDSDVGASDIIHDFTKGDKIDLSSLDADVSRAGNQTFDFGDRNAEGEVWTVRDGNDLRVRVSVKGDDVQDEVVEITLNEFAGDLTAADFIL